MRKIIFLTIICMIYLQSLLCQEGCFFTNQSTVSGATKYSGDIYLDKINNEEYNYLTTKFGVYPDMWYLYDGNQPNAYATSDLTNKNLPDGTVFIGLNLILIECKQSPSQTCSSIPIVLAHEFAHLVDFKYNTGLKGKYKELFADYLAGCYMYFRSVEFKTTFIDEVAKSFYDKGDYAFWDKQHHGTPTQRYECLISGYYLAKEYALNSQLLTLQNAIDNAILKVKKY